jgi:lipid A 3-O-deacylase
MRSLPHLRITAVIAVAFIGVCPPRPAQAQADQVERGTISFYFENDAFAGTDRYYTNGTKLGWTSPDLRKYDEAHYRRPYLPLIDDIPFVQDEAFQKNLFLTIGQNIYTPDNTEAMGPVIGDRPYAGWLYGGIGVIWQNDRVRNSLIMNLGVVGPWSYAEATQQFVHEILGDRSPNGWDNQLRNELGVVLTYERTWRGARGWIGNCCRRPPFPPAMF